MPFEVVKPKSLADYLEQMSRAVFYAGMNWSVIDAKWAGIHEAFDGFDPEKVAAYTPTDVERLMSDSRVVRNRKKIEGTIHNAGEVLNVDRQFDGFGNYLKSFADSAALAEDLHKRFKFLGESTARFFLFSIGFDTAAQEAWAIKRFGTMHEPR